MSCDHKLVEQYLFDYLDGTIEPTMARAIEQMLDQCDSCRDLYQSAVETQQLERNWQQQAVPSWHRTKFAVAQPAKNSFGWGNRLSFAMSFFAIALVLFQVNVTSNNEGFSISFGGNNNKAVIAEAVTEQFNQLASQQADYIDARFEEQNIQRINDNKEMLETLMTSNRKERRQDLNILMASWLQQRDLDQKSLNQRVDNVVDNQIENNRSINHLLRVSN
ncbi:MAG: zf-HC2 domain-containing protein [Gammaproteobacteria bacterium]|nr:zf-HC2 domain-containing protein [Gammaproteobacteria bacterium]